MPYVLFANKAAKFGSPQLTIRSGKISFNADAGDNLAQTGMKFAHILWDAAACKIAIRPIAKKDDTAFKVSISKGKRGGMLSARSFLSYIHWDAQEPITIPAEWNEREGLLEAVLPRKNILVERTRR